MAILIPDIGPPTFFFIVCMQMNKYNYLDIFVYLYPPLHHQVLALVIDPTNFNEDKYPADCKSRARAILDGCGGGSVGAYSDSAGIEVIRQHVADYITRRDCGIPACWEEVFLSAGASQSIKAVMNLLNITQANGHKTGVMVPIPQYPLYSATIAEYGMNQV